MHDWAEMARFARSGGEANSIAIRIARAATGRDVVAALWISWLHDWYLATNLKNNSGRRTFIAWIRGLELPKALSETTHPFSFNKFWQLEKIASKYKLAAVNGSSEVMSQMKNF